MKLLRRLLTGCFLVGAVNCASQRVDLPQLLWPVAELVDVPAPTGWELVEEPAVLMIAGGSIRRAELLIKRQDSLEDGLPAWKQAVLAAGWQAHGNTGLQWRKGDNVLSLRQRGPYRVVALSGP